LSSAVHTEDYSRPTTFACSRTNGGYNGYEKAVNVFGYNYRPNEYGKFRSANPFIPIFGSETASAVSSRGEYFFPVTRANGGALCDFQVSSYDITGTVSPDDEFKGLDQYPFAAGEFVWTGFDYLGEPTPFGGASTKPLRFTDPARQAQADQELKDTGKILVPSRSSYFGIVDLAGFPKDRYYLYQARWRPDLPMAHLLPHWTWPERVDQVTPVYVYTSGDEAELFLNGRSMGRKRKGPGEYRLRWDDVKYVPGELKAVAYKEGKEWAVDTVKTAGPGAKILLEKESSEPRVDAPETVYVDATIIDAKGVPAPGAASLLRFSVTGPGEIIATDNGDATDHTKFQSAERRAFGGKCLAILRLKPGATDAVTVRVESDGLETTELRLRDPSR
jgi:beta-galactosidase